MRLFAALPISDEAKDRLLHLRLRLGTPKDGLRWAEPEQWHITLTFFGEVPPPQREQLLRGFHEMRHPAPAMVLDGLGLFRTKGILYATIAPSASLLRLQQETARLGLQAGLRSERSVFLPHITLARARGKAGYRSIQQLATPSLPTLGAPVRWSARECLLLESQLGAQGATYTPQAAQSLHADQEP